MALLFFFCQCLAFPLAPYNDTCGLQSNFDSRPVGSICCDSYNLYGGAKKGHINVNNDPLHHEWTLLPQSYNSLW